MVLEGGELHLQRVADVSAEIRRDFTASGCTIPRDSILRRAADIVACYPEAWSRYDAPPDDWDGRFAVTVLWTWRKIRAERPRLRAAAA